MPPGRYFTKCRKNSRSRVATLFCARSTAIGSRSPTRCGRPCTSSSTAKFKSSTTRNWPKGTMQRDQRAQDLGRDLNRPEEALASYDRALAHRPDHPEAYTRPGLARWDLKRSEVSTAERMHSSTPLP